MVAMLLGSLAQPAGAAAQSPVRWVAAPSLATPRSAPAVFTLPDGRMVLYGSNSVGPVSEFYDPRSGSGGATGEGDGRAAAAVALLADGRLLVAGEIESPAAISTTGTVVATVTIYDPATGHAVAAPPLAERRTGHTATTLRDGTVLVVGGFDTGGVGRTMGAGVIAQAERFDPRTGHWSPAGRLATPRGDHTATLLHDGRVLVVGGFASGHGDLASAELYDPATNAWTPTGTLAVARRFPVAVALAAGGILIVGAEDTTPERYDPATGRWASAGTLPQARRDFAAARLTDGRVLVAGGEVRGRGVSATTALYDPATNRWMAGPPLAAARRLGEALLVGGYDGERNVLAGVERLAADPSARCFAATGQCIGGRFLDYWEAHGGLAVNGYPLGPERADVLADGREHIVQYFERARFECHPANAAPYNVLLGQFGRQVLAARVGAVPPAAPLAGGRFFPETGHNLSGDFRAFWETHGGLAQFGLPLSEVFTERLEDGESYPVQYFERARLERHTTAEGTTILLGQFGRVILAEQGELAADAGR